MKQKSIKKNFLMNIVLTMSSFIFPLITFPYVSRVLLPAGTGKVAFATSVISYFSLFANLGIPMYGIRACAKVRDDREELTRTAHELLIINIITAVITYFALFVSILFIHKFQAEKKLLMIISASIIFSALGIEWLYKALEQYTYITIRSVIFKFIALFAMFMLVRNESDYVEYGFITIFAASASNILNLINAHKYIGFKYVGNYNICQHLKPIVVFFAMACATTIYTNLDVVMLGFMKTDTDVGYYNAAVKIKVILVSIVTSLGAVILPRASYYVEHGQREEFERICRKALNFVLLIAVPMTIYFIFYARSGIYFLSGEAYAGSVVPMQIIMPTLILIGITNILGIQILVPTGREKAVLYSEIAGAIADVIINALLIPRMASAGAAIGTLVAEIVVLLVQYCYLKNELNSIVKGISIIRILIANVIAMLASFWIGFVDLNSFFTLLISGGLYFGVYGLYMLFRKEEIAVEVWGTVYKIVSRK